MQFINAILLIKWKMGGAQSSLPRPSLLAFERSYYDDKQDRTKKAVLGGPSSDETFPLREKTKF